MEEDMLCHLASTIVAGTTHTVAEAVDKAEAIQAEVRERANKRGDTETAVALKERAGLEKTT